jgi:hypothetical protein
MKDAKEMQKQSDTTLLNKMQQHTREPNAEEAHVWIALGQNCHLLEIIDVDIEAFDLHHNDIDNHSVICFTFWSRFKHRENANTNSRLK